MMKRYEASRADSGGARSTAPTPCMKSRVLLKSAVQAYPFPLHIAWQIGRSNNTEQQTSKKKKKKNNTLDHYSPPILPPLTPPVSYDCRRARLSSQVV